jgi:hypothetical protein
MGEKKKLGISDRLHNPHNLCSKGLAARQIDSVPIEERDAITLLHYNSQLFPGSAFPLQWGLFVS